MALTLDIREPMEIIGADGVKVGVVDKVVGNRIKLTRDDGHGGKMDHHHFLPFDLAADTEDGKLRLSATAANAMTLRQEENGNPVTGEPMSKASDSAFAFGQDAGKSDAGKSDGGKTSMPNATGTVVASQKSVPVPQIPTTKSPAKTDSKTKGLGTAALSIAAIGAAALGAAAFGKTDAGKTSLAKIKGVGKTKAATKLLPLDDDENMRLISSAKVEGTKVVDRNGMSVGTIQSVMIDKYSGRVAYAILSFGGTFGFGATLFPLPWASLDYDVAKDGYVLALTKEQLASAPKFEARDTPEFDAPYRTRIVAFYRAM